MRTIAFPVLVMSLALLGGGCFASQPTPLDGIEASVDARNDAKELSEGMNEQQRRQADAMTTDIPVAMIVTEGNEAPDAVVRTGPVIGCQDTVAFVRVFRETDSGLVERDALNTLLAQKESTVEGVHNALFQSDLSVERIVTADDGVLEVRLVGNVASGGACDDPRIKAQVEHTVMQYSPNMRVTLNGSEAEWRCIGDQSGECE